MAWEILAITITVFVLVIPIVPGQRLSPQNSSASVCPDISQCGECITRDPTCGWCAANDYTLSRCDDVINLRNRGCVNITYPEGSLKITKNLPLTDADESPDDQAVQVAPQGIRVTLKVGEPQRFRLFVRLAEDYPLDLYYLMDLSYSLKQDLVNVGRLGVTLERELKKLTRDLQLGFGSFVDKTTIPFTVNNVTCNDACCRDCVYPFSFKNQLPLTKDTGSFATRVSQLRVSTSIDTPEGGLDALIQVAACQEQINWRNRARHMVLYATDAAFHMAGDGKLAGISSRNDGLCHLDPWTNEYDKSAEQDFPSLGQISALLQKKNIIPVFAVTGKVHSLYEELSHVIAGAKVGQLSANSANVVTLITNQYKEITSEVNIIDNSPENIALSYISNCINQDPVQGSTRCSGLLLSETIWFDVAIKATDCSPTGGPQTFIVRPFGFDESLTIVADVICECDCESKGIREPTMCTSGNGTLTCGQCACDEGRYGTECECDGNSATDFNDVSACIRPNSTSPSVCQRRGMCICGQCVCDKPTYAGRMIYGQYCECDNSCDEFQGKPCGGEQRGECICDKNTLNRYCKCKPEYTGSACECVTSKKACQTISGLECNGWGNCTCEGTCRCEESSPFDGDICESCPTCKGKCSSFQECVLCKVFDKGSFSEDKCDMCAGTFQIEEDLVKLNGTDTILCEYLDDDNCTIIYIYELTDDGTYVVRVQREKVCRRVVRRERLLAIDWKWLIIGIIAGILLLGILLISLIRIGFFIQDRREYAKFEKEKGGAMWNDGDNPLFKSSTSTFQNPIYGK